MSKKMKVSVDLNEFRAEIIAVIAKYDLSPLEILAMTSYVVGQLLALQDQTKYSVAACLECIQLNIEQGNQDMINELMNASGTKQ